MPCINEIMCMQKQGSRAPRDSDKVGKEGGGLHEGSTAAGVTTNATLFCLLVLVKEDH